MIDTINKYNHLDEELKAKQETILSSLCPHKPEIGTEFIEKHLESPRLSNRTGDNWFVNVHHLSVDDQKRLQEEREQKYKERHIEGKV